MYAGIAAAVPGNHLSDIGAAVEDIAREHGYGIVRAFVGHGIGNEMHEEPQVPNYRTGSRGRRLEPGLCLAIEPMFTLGSHEVRVSDDGWTVETARRQARRTLGAHDRRYCRRAAHPDRVNDGTPQTTRSRCCKASARPGHWHFRCARTLLSSESRNPSRGDLAPTSGARTAADIASSRVRALSRQSVSSRRAYNVVTST